MCKKKRVNLIRLMSNGLQKGFRWNSEVKGNSYTESGIFVIGVNSREKWRLWKKGEINL